MVGRGDEDPFVALLRWTAREAGGLDAVATGSGVALRTLQDWLQGRYPTRRTSAQVDRLHDWALGAVRGYPPEGTPVGGFADLSGPLRVQLGGTTTTNPAAAVEGRASRPEPVPRAAADGAPPRRRPRWRGRRGPVVAGVTALVTAVAVGSVLAARPAHSGPGLPHGPTSPAYTEETAYGGANTFTDPRGPSGQGPKIPPKTVLEVGCFYHAPSIPSVVPDGNWYLIISPPYAGLWSPANSWLNGDGPHANPVHNTDFAVPPCR